MVDYHDNAAEAEFRSTLRAWLAENAPLEQDLPVHEWAEWSRKWHQDLHRGGYVGMAWPKEFGGRGLSPIYDAILAEEVGQFGAPRLPSFANFLGRTLFTFGTPEQVATYLPGLQNGTTQWCQGFSEPEAGSDLGSLRTRAVRVDDHYVLNGEKMWTSGAQNAEWCLMLVRTDPDVPKHKGITCLLVAMDTPGITVRPIIVTNGEAHTCQVYLDDVVVPAERRVGEDGQGWRIAVTTLAAERGPESSRFVATYRKRLRGVEGVARDRGLLEDGAVRERLASAYVDGEAHRLFVLNQLSLIESKTDIGTEGSIAKLLWSKEEQGLHHVVLNLLGADALIGEEQKWLDHYFWSRVASVYGGAGQIQRNILAERQLGMPRAAR